LWEYASIHSSFNNAHEYESANNNNSTVLFIADDDIGLFVDSDSTRSDSAYNLRLEQPERSAVTRIDLRGVRVLLKGKKLKEGLFPV
jgi:hypothetical protein